MRPVFDGHNDALTADDHAQLAGGKPGGHLDLPRMRAGGVRGAIFAVFADGPDGDLPADGSDPDSHRLWGQPLADPLDHAWAAGVATRAAGRLGALELAGEVTIARTAADLDAVHDDPALPPAAVLHVEGAEAIDPELEALPFWYEAGLRSLGPVWSRPNWFAEGVPFRAPSSPDTGGGLTEAGRRLVGRCGELGILVDLSHLNEQGFWDVAALSTAPLVATHSNVHALCPSTRNLTERQLDAIRESRGVVGLNFATCFLRPDGAMRADTDLDLMRRHLDALLERLGEDGVAFGSDFDGAVVPAEIGSVAGLPKLIDRLRQAGYGEALLVKIAHANWLSLLERTWG